MSRKGKKKARELRQVDFSALERQGKDDFQAGRYRQAISAWERCSKGAEVGTQNLASLQVDLGEAHYRLALSKPALSYAEGEDPALRISELKRAVRYCPQVARYKYALGLAYLLQGNEARALEEFLQVLDLEDQAEECRLGEALAWIGMDAGGTMAMLEEQMTSAPLHPSPSAQKWSRLLGLAQLKAGNYEAALELAKQTEETTSTPQHSSTSAQSGAELFYFRLLAAAGEFLAGNYAGVANRLENLLEDKSAAALSPSFLCQAYDLLGASFLASQRFADAARSWDQCLSLGDSKRQETLASLYLYLAREDLVRERFAEAREMLTKALALRPGNEAIQKVLRQGDFMLAQRAAQKGDWQEAARLWRVLVERGEGERVRHNLALALENLGESEQANLHWQELARTWKKERKDSPSTKEQRARLALLHRHLARNHNKMGDSHRATQEYEKALNYNPSDLDTRLEVAELYLDFDQYGSAIPHLKRVLEQRADDVQALNSLGIAYNLQGKSKEALACWQQVLAMDPDNALAREMAAEHHAERVFEHWGRGEHTQALEELQRQRELQPNAYHPYCNQGEIYLEMGKQKLAKDAFAKAMAFDPHNPDIAVDIGGHCLRQNKKKMAENYFRQALRIKNDAYILCDIGLAYGGNGGDFRKAQKYFQQALAFGEKEIPVRIGEGLQRLESPLARIYFEEAVRQDPDDPGPHLALGFEYFSWQDLEQSREEIAQAERLLANSDIPRRQDMREELRMAKEMLAVAGRLDSLPGPGGFKLPRY